MQTQQQTDRQIRFQALAREQLASMRASARAARDSRQAVDDAAVRLTELRAANPILASAKAQQVTGYLTALAALVAVYLLDVLLFAPVSDHFVSQSFPDTPWLTKAALLALPLAIVTCEILVSTQRSRAAQARFERLGGRGPVVAWLAVSIVLAFMMPTAVVATYMSGFEPTGAQAAGFSPASEATAFESFDPWVDGPLVIALASLSLVAHLSVLFGGSLAADAKAYVVFLVQQGRLTSNLQQGTRSQQRHEDAASDLFDTYFDTLGRHNAEFPDRQLQPGPFDSVTSEVVNRARGYEAIRTVAAAAAPSAGPNAQASQAAGGPPQGPAEQRAPSVPSAEPRTDWSAAAAAGWSMDEAEVRA